MNLQKKFCPGSINFLAPPLLACDSPKYELQWLVFEIAYTCVRSYIYIRTIYFTYPIPHIPYNKEVLIGLANSVQIHFCWHDLLPIRFCSMEGPPPNLLWHIFLTVRCLSRTINSRRVLQLSENWTIIYPQEECTKTRRKNRQLNKNYITSKSMFTVSMMKKLI